MAKEIGAGVHWVNPCLDDDPAQHAHQSVFLIQGQSKTLLVDTGAPQLWDVVVEEVESLLGHRPLDYIYLTHAEIVHMGNAQRWMDRHPETTVLGGNVQMIVQLDPERYQQTDPGDTLDLGDRRIEFIEPVILDLPRTLWAYDPVSGLLTVADAFAYFHESGAQCDYWAEQIRETLRPQDMVDFYVPRFPLLKYVRAEDLNREFDRVFERDVRVVAPAHGKVSLEPEWYLEVQKEAIRQLSRIGVGA
jgi:flavorubredoxin